MNKKITRELWLYVRLWLLTLGVSYVLLTPVMRIGEINLTDFLMDGCAVAFFLFLSLFCNKVFIRLLRPLQHYGSKLFVYWLLLLATNVLIAIATTKFLFLFWGELPYQEYVITVYFLALLATFASGIHANITFQERFRKQQEEKHHLEMEVAKQREANLQASLMMLKSQVDPHFLFNSFGLLGELIDENSDEAHRFLDNLSRVYRYKLVNMNAHLVSLANELRMLRAYVGLLQTRYGQAISVQLPSEEAAGGVQQMGIPPLAVQLLVENAVKHNAHSTSHPLVLRVQIDGEQLAVSNKLQPLSSPVESTSIGLANLKERYRLLAHEQPTIQNDGHSFTVTLPLIKI